VHGVTELEQVIKQSPDDQPVVITELAAFIRSMTNAKDCPKVGRDVQAALTVLARRQMGSDRGTALDLHGACLRSAEMTDISLVQANLTGTNLVGANLTRAILDGADLTDADLARANLTDAHVVDARAARLDLTGANLVGANMKYSR
jgi:uncharacterized protein YjbI with pentapeptide repeats